MKDSTSVNLIPIIIFFLSLCVSLHQFSVHILLYYYTLLLGESHTNNFYENNYYINCPIIVSELFGPAIIELQYQGYNHIIIIQFIIKQHNMS